MEIKWNLNSRLKLLVNLGYIWNRLKLYLGVSCFSLVLICSLLNSNAIIAQEDDDMLKERRTDLYYGWNNEYEVGAQFMALGFSNPPAGKGGGQLSGGLNLRASLIKNDIYHIWENEGFINLNFQRKGDEVLNFEDFRDSTMFFNPLVRTQDAPWTKNQDEFRASSKYSWRTNSDTRIYYSGFTKLRTQILNSYGADRERNYSGSYAKNYGDNLTKNSAFMAPGVWTTGLGLEYRDKYNQYSIFYSPATYKAIIVLNDEIAELAAINEVMEFNPMTLMDELVNDHEGSLHGNPQEYSREDDDVFNVKKIRHQVGSQLLARYEGDIIPEKLTVNSDLDVFIDYLGQSLTFDVDWQNEISYIIIGGLAVNLTVDLFHDKDVPLTFVDDNGNTTLERRGVFITHRFSISYNDTF